MTGFLSLLRPRDKQRARLLYSVLLKAALDPRLYQSGTGTDTFEGRAAMVTVHASLLVHRLASLQDGRANRLAKSVNALILDGFDAAFRERGVGDSTIARKVRNLAEQHSGLGRSLLSALDSAEPGAADEIEAVLKRNAVSEAGKERRLADYILASREGLAALPDAVVLSAGFDWPGPE